MHNAGSNHCGGKRVSCRGIVQRDSVQAEGRSHFRSSRDGISEDEFVRVRTERDQQLDMPALLLPSVQINMRAGHVPPPDSKERFFLKLPLNVFGGPNLKPLQAKE